jgi:hypothetical protein
MNVRASIYRVSTSGTNPTDFVEFGDLVVDGCNYADSPIQYLSPLGANVLFPGDTSDMPPDYVPDQPQNWNPTINYPVQGNATCDDDGTADAWMLVYANADNIDSISRYVAWVNPRSSFNTASDIPFDDATVARINRKAWYYTPFNISESCWPPWEETVFQEFRHAFRVGDLNSTACTVTSDCDEINVATNVDTSALTYVPKSIKVTNNASLPTYFTVGAGKGCGGFGVTNPDDPGTAGNKGEWDFENLFFSEFLCGGGEVRFEDTCNSAETAYPHISGFIEPSTSSPEYLIDNKFEYIIMQAVRVNTNGALGNNNFWSSEMISELFLISETALDPDIREFWEGWMETGYVVEAPWPGHHDHIYGKLYGHSYREDSYGGGFFRPGGRHTMRINEVVVGAINRNSNIELTYSEPETLVDNIGTSSLEQANIPSNYTPGGSLNLSAAVNADIEFGPYTGYHFKFDLLSGAVVKELGAFDAISNGWEYDYHFSSPFEHQTSVDSWGGFHLAPSCGPGCYPFGHFSPYYTYVDSAMSGFRGFTVEAGSDPIIDGEWMGPYITQQIYNQAGIDYVNSLQQSTSENYNREGEGPFIREGLFEISNCSGEETAGHIIGLQTTYLTATYDWTNGALETYEQVYLSEPISIDVYRVDHEVSLGNY